MPTSERLNISSRSRSSASSSACCDFRREMSVSTATTSCSSAVASARRTDIETQAGAPAAAPGRLTASSVSASPAQPAAPPGPRKAAEQLVQRRPRHGARLQPEHALEAPVAAHEHGTAQVGDAGCRAVEDGRQFAQQLLAAALRVLLLGHVERHDRRRALARPRFARLDPRQQPAQAQLRVAHRVAHLDAFAVAQRAAAFRSRAATRARPVRG